MHKINLLFLKNKKKIFYVTTMQNIFYIQNIFNKISMLLYSFVIFLITLYNYTDTSFIKDNRLKIIFFLILKPIKIINCKPHK